MYFHVPAVTRWAGWLLAAKLDVIRVKNVYLQEIPALLTFVSERTNRNEQRTVAIVIVSVSESLLLSLPFERPADDNEESSSTFSP